MFLASRLFLVYLIPMGIGAIVYFGTSAFFPNDGTGGGGSLSATGQIIATVGLFIAIGVVFFFHFKTRHWPLI
ncbi:MULTISPECIES: hypothetical protein [Mesorhizobium]|uniref:hypothetical protein n=1 Tax=Mesorhizobium TaxID=68287 RepID=UPI0010A96ED5|nr:MULTISPECIES: hypothetical protein [Mesorhizobium]